MEVLYYLRYNANNGALSTTQPGAEGPVTIVGPPAGANEVPGDDDFLVTSPVSTFNSVAASTGTINYTVGMIKCPLSDSQARGSWIISWQFTVYAAGGVWQSATVDQTYSAGDSLPAIISDSVSIPFTDQKGSIPTAVQLDIYVSVSCPFGGTWPAGTTTWAAYAGTDVNPSLYNVANGTGSVSLGMNVVGANTVSLTTHGSETMAADVTSAGSGTGLNRIWFCDVSRGKRNGCRGAADSPRTALECWRTLTETSCWPSARTES